MVAWIWEVAVENGDEVVEVWVYLESGGDDGLSLGWWEKDESRKIPRSEHECTCCPLGCQSP